MATVKEINVEVGFTKNLGNYQNIKFVAGLAYDLKEGDNPTKVFKEAWNKAGDEIKKQLDLFESEDKSGVQKGL